MISIWQMIYELEFWISIGTGDDIVRCPDQRKEYQHIVQMLKDQKVQDEFIPGRVVAHLKAEARLPFYKRKTFWVLLKMLLRHPLKRLQLKG